MPHIFKFNQKEKILTFIKKFLCIFEGFKIKI
jgi:hypothetical protein